jgi:hypothetical protein
MPGPTASELDHLRSSLDYWRNEAAVVNRLTRTSDGKGGFTNQWSTVWSGTVRRKPTSETRGAAIEAAVGDLQDALTYWIFTMPAGIDVRADDRIVASGRTFEVVGDLDKSLEIARYVIATEQTSGNQS